MTPQEKITKARAGLILDAPFFGSLALRTKLIEDPDCETAWINGPEMGFNPGYIEGLSLDQAKGLLGHEVMHLAAAHHARRQDRNAKKWNMATDAAINGILERSGFILPPGHIPGAPDDQSAESLYNALPDPPPDAGSDPGKSGEVRDAPGKDGNQAGPAEMAQAEAEARVMVAQAAQQAKSMGKLPTDIARMVDEMLQPKLDWAALLRRFVERTTKDDYRWTPPNRRFIHDGIYLPSAHSETLGDIVVAVDTSGSIGNKEISEFAAEISAILEDFRTTATVIYCDTAISNIETFTQDNLPLELHPKGGGGTSFVPPFDYVTEMGTVPACLIYLTDLESSHFPAEPDYPVLWVKTPGYGTPPPFGEVIELV
jgi:predicted metal-dependent peptidase